MFVVQFPSLRCLEYSDPILYENRVGKFLQIREGENCYLLGNMAQIKAQFATPGVPRAHLLSIEDGNQVVAAAILFPTGCLFITWATPEMKTVPADALFKAKYQITSVYAPAHVSWRFAETWAALSQQDYQLERSERIYQLARPSHTPRPSGKLELALPEDKPLLIPWVTDFLRETKYETEIKQTDFNKAQAIVDELIATKILYLWKDPLPVAMAANAKSTPHGGCINFVYTPPEQRGHGYAKDVVAAVGKSMLKSGLRYCFILTDTDDELTNRLYQKVGARTLCELLRCNIIPAQKSPAVASPTAAATCV